MTSVYCEKVQMLLHRGSNADQAALAWEGQGRRHQRARAVAVLSAADGVSEHVCRTVKAAQSEYDNSRVNDASNCLDDPAPPISSNGRSNRTQSLAHSVVNIQAQSDQALRQGEHEAYPAVMTT